MGNENAVSKASLSDRRRFAQVCNNQFFGGREVIQLKIRQM